MSLSNQQFTFGAFGIATYSPADLIATGARALLLSFNVASTKIAGLSIGLGVNDLLAWNTGLEFDLIVNGSSKILITDELCTLLQKEFFPMDLPQNAKVELFCKNSHTTDIYVAAFIRTEVA